jgi:cellulose synthase/poly-beta-1,6-N-acetylglucosamine synthase-like glycosyltransferase
MNLEILAYPFIFAAIYFEAFLLVTFLSAPAVASRRRIPSTKTPLVAMIVPCYNEEKTVRGTVESLLALEYPKDKLRIILVNDGSIDGTAAVMDSFAHEPQVTVIHQKNQGKHVALNAGIEAVPDAELIGCLDADSFVEAGALREMIGCFDDPQVGASTAAMSVYKPSNTLERMQNAEYILGIALRHILAAVNGLYVTPGPFSVYRRDVVVELGGFRNGHNTEDMEMALRIQRAGYAIDSAPLARVFTKAPRSVPALLKQRTRWTTGFLRNMMNEYRDLVGNPQYGALGLIVLPLGFLAIIGGITMFLLVTYQTVKQIVETFFLTSGVPVTYTLSTFVPKASTLQWFYLPVSIMALLAFVALAGSLLFMVVGKSISKTPGSMSAGIIGYLLLYGLIAPFWLLRAVADVATSNKRSWR